MGQILEFGSVYIKPKRSCALFCFLSSTGDVVSCYLYLSRKTTKTKKKKKPLRNCSISRMIENFQVSHYALSSGFFFNCIGVNGLSHRGLSPIPSLLRNISSHF